VPGFVNHRAHESAGHPLPASCRNDRETNQVTQSWNHFAGAVVRAAEDTQNHPDDAVLVHSYVYVGATL
jgi:hypothetical protein